MTTAKPSTSKGGFHHSAGGHSAVGRRKTAVARVYMKTGSGEFTVNGKPFAEYFGRKTLQMVVMQPLETVGQKEKVDIFVNVKGGGPSGQAGAVQHGISRALLKVSDTFRAKLKPEGFLTRDARAVERKKYGRHKARKRPQYSKR